MSSFSFVIVESTPTPNPNSTNGVVEFFFDGGASRLVKKDWAEGDYHPLASVSAGWYAPKIVPVTPELLAAVVAADWRGELGLCEAEAMVGEYAFASREEAERALARIPR